jgi:hypothetical protein
MGNSAVEAKTTEIGQAQLATVGLDPLWRDYHTANRTYAPIRSAQQSRARSRRDQHFACHDRDAVYGDQLRPHGTGLSECGFCVPYVGQEINPALGYVTGRSMAMDYMLNPAICIIWCSKAAMTFVPGSHYFGQ